MGKVNFGDLFKTSSSQVCTKYEVHVNEKKEQVTQISW